MNNIYERYKKNNNDFIGKFLVQIYQDYSRDRKEKPEIIGQITNVSQTGIQVDSMAENQEYLFEEYSDLPGTTILELDHGYLVVPVVVERRGLFYVNKTKRLHPIVEKALGIN